MDPVWIGLGNRIFVPNFRVLVAVGGWGRGAYQIKRHNDGFLRPPRTDALIRLTTYIGLRILSWCPSWDQLNININNSNWVHDAVNDFEVCMNFSCIDHISSEEAVWWTQVDSFKFGSWLLLDKPRFRLLLKSIHNYINRSCQKQRHRRRAWQRKCKK